MLTNNNDKSRFGGMRESVIKRDSEKCVICGMTRKEHKHKFKCDITVDHIDGKGRNSRFKNNRLSNLQTLCLPCHGKKDFSKSSLSKLTESDVLEIRKLYPTLNYREISDNYGVTLQQIFYIIKRKTWKHV